MQDLLGQELVGCPVAVAVYGEGKPGARRLADWLLQGAVAGRVRGVQLCAGRPQPPPAGRQPAGADAPRAPQAPFQHRRSRALLRPQLPQRRTAWTCSSTAATRGPGGAAAVGGWAGREGRGPCACA